MTSDPDHFNHALHDKLMQSELFTTYLYAFRCAIGLPLHFVPVDAEGSAVCSQLGNGSAFCEKLNLCGTACKACIEWAKWELLKPGARVSEIAFHIGYQSLSQFNRSFARFTRNSRTNFRREELARVTAV